MTSFSDEDTDKLIEMIRQHPELFNCQLDSYRDETLKNNIWKRIAECLNKTDSECRKKWKLIKNSYNRYKRKLKYPTGSAAPAKNSKWQFFERLRFLENTPSERESSINIMDTDNTNSPSEVVDVDTEVDKEPSVAKDAPSKEVVQAPGTATALDTSTTGTSVPVNTNSYKHTRGISKRKKSDDEFLKLLKQRDENIQLQLQALAPSQHTCQQPMDEISSFSKNIEMSLRKLSVRSRSMAKSEIFNIISKYEMIDIDEENARSCFSSSLSNTTPYSPASPISQHEPQATLLDLSTTPHQLTPLPQQQFEDISKELQNVLENQFQNHPSPTSQQFI